MELLLLDQKQLSVLTTTGHIHGQDLMSRRAGVNIVYSVREITSIDGYTTTVTGDAETGFIIKNSYTPETTSVSGSKTWNDADDQDGKRPENIKVNLLADGSVYATKTVTEAENWEYSFYQIFQSIEMVEFRSSILYLRLMYQNIQVRLQVIISRTVTHRERQVYQLQRSGVITITRTAREHLA